ncbi:MAG: hypothetical protein DWQ07_13085 [Chloroflexi bacterium]|nr:MAG: hypothetical protein DWQ07_13085 [Chloroflexota bacterium]MBL1196975.1 hypothetical protein [Chloroflexota bacterium]NOH14270.1 hypothetical protein [Chloroflexota bacterium]
MIVGDWVRSKGIQFLLILLLGVSIIRALPLIRFYLGGWHSLVTLDSLDLIEVNKTNGDLWGIGNHLYRYERQLGNVILWGKQIDLPLGYWIEHPIRFCPSQQIWVVYRDKMISYDPDGDLWHTEHPELESIGQPIDCFYINDKIAILGEKAIAYADGPIWRKIQLPAGHEDHGKMIVQNHEGEWRLLTGNSFYEMNETAEGWQKITTYETPKAEDNVLILLEVYTYDNYYWQGIG